MHIDKVARPRPKCIYIQQYGTFWKLTYKEWIDLCLDMVSQMDSENYRGYELPHNRQLAKRPRTIIKVEEPDHTWYDAQWPHILITPLDWEPENFKFWLDQNCTEALSSRGGKK